MGTVRPLFAVFGSARTASSNLVTLFIDPCAPRQNPFAKSFHACSRDELLDQESLQSVREAQAVLDGYHEDRQRGALGDATSPLSEGLNRKASDSLRPVATP